MSGSGPSPPRVVSLLDVDDTLLDNDRIIEDLHGYLEATAGAACRDRYWKIFTERRRELGYADYLGALQRYRLEYAREPHVLSASLFLLDYPFAERVYPRAFELVERLSQTATPVIFSDGDAVFQPCKVSRSGLWDAVGGRVLIYVHKEQMLEDVADRYPAAHYVLVDDKLRILTAIKRAWGRRVTTVFPRQGHYAHDPELLREYPPADVTVERIGDLADWSVTALVDRAAAP